jgi:hypothetical protein
MTDKNDRAILRNGHDVGLWYRLTGKKDATGNLDGITRKTGMSGNCDICNAAMPPSGGIVTARAMKLLVESGFNPEPRPGPMEFLAREMEKLGVSRAASTASMKRKMLNEELGDFGICPNCFERVMAHRV